MAGSRGLSPLRHGPHYSHRWEGLGAGERPTLPLTKQHTCPFLLSPNKALIGKCREPQELYRRKEIRLVRQNFLLLNHCVRQQLKTRATWIVRPLHGTKSMLPETSWVGTGVFLGDTQARQILDADNLVTDTSYGCKQIKGGILSGVAKKMFRPQTSAPKP